MELYIIYFGLVMGLLTVRQLWNNSFILSLVQQYSIKMI